MGKSIEINPRDVQQSRHITITETAYVPTEAIGIDRQVVKRHFGVKPPNSRFPAIVGSSLRSRLGLGV